MGLSVSSRHILRRPTTGAERINKNQRRKTAFLLVVMCTVLIVILVAIGFFYTWLTSNQIMPNDAFSTNSQKPVEIKKPVTRTNQRVNVAVSSLSSPIIAGEEAQLSIRTNVDSVCTIEVIAGSTKLTGTDFTAKAADEYGIVSWNWAVPKSTGAASWPITVACNNKEYSGVVKTSLVITAPKP